MVGAARGVPLVALCLVGEGTGALAEEGNEGKPLEAWAGPEVPTAAAPAAPVVQRFRPRHVLSGLMAAGTVAALSLAACGLSLLWPPLAQQAPPWLLWTLRGLPLPAFLLLWAVAAEAQYKVLVDPAGITFRRALGSTVRVPWASITDYYLDCRRPVWQAPAANAAPAGPGDGRQAISLTGRSVANRPAEASFALVTDPDRAQPDYVIESPAGRFRFDHGLENVRRLCALVAERAVRARWGRWEERPAFRCPRCGSVFAFRVAPRPAPLDDTLWVLPAPPPSCPACGTSAPELAALVARHGLAQAVVPPDQGAPGDEGTPGQAL